MLNDNNTGLMRCKTVKVATLDSITQYFSSPPQQMSPSVYLTVVGAAAR